METTKTGLNNDQVATDAAVGQSILMATGTITPMFGGGYMQIYLQIPTLGSAFYGSVPLIRMTATGVAEVSGNLYSNDMTALLKNTSGSEYVSTSENLTIFFYDAQQNVLGKFQTNSASTILGIAGGPGGWS